jgi:thiol:disulfide interchange protein DsbG
MKKNLSMAAMLWLALFIPMAASAAAVSSLPPPIKALEAHGFQIESQFEAAGGMIGYVAQYRGRPITIYLTPDRKYAIVGTMVDGQANDVGAVAVARVTAAKYKDIWPKLEKASFVVDGASDAERIVYEFTDPNCPYCHKFWQDSRPWVKAGKVQIREIIVGILTPTSSAKAVAVLAADDPTAALAQNEKDYGKGGGGIEPLSDPPSSATRKIEANNALMQSLEFFAPPTIVYRDHDGQVQVVQGAPRDQGLIDVMGSTKP